jgi:CRP-like cAMP-binding protein
VDLRDNWFLAALPDEDLTRLARSLAPVEYRRGQVLCEPGQELDAVWLFRTGLSSDVHVLEDGFEVEVCAFGCESAFGLGAALGHALSFTRDLVQVPGDGWRLPAPAFREAYARSPAMQALVLRHVQTAIGFMARTVACNARHALEARLCRWLLTAADHSHGEAVATTHEFLAVMLGVTRTSVTLGAGELQKQGAIAVRRGEVAILDRPLLERRSCRCYAFTREAWEAVRPGAAHAIAGV